MSFFENIAHSEDFVIENGVLKEYKGNSSYVVIPEGVTEIGEKCFEDIMLKSVSIPTTLIKCGKDAFAGCKKLNSIYITDLSKWCNIDFYNDRSNPLNESGILFFNDAPVIDLVIPDDVEVIKRNAFCNCKSIKSAEFPDALKRINEKAFYRCSGIEKVEFPFWVEEIGEYAFFECTSLRDVLILGKETVIGKYAFGQCKNIFTMGSASEKTMGDSAFDGYWESMGKCTFCGGDVRKLPFKRKCKKCGQKLYY